MSHNRNRLKTNSLTHLTKIIAEEVFEEYTKNRFTRPDFNDMNEQIIFLTAKSKSLDKKILISSNTLQYLEKRVKAVSKKMENVKVTNIDTKEALKKVNNDLLKAGGLWSDDEDELLERELNVAVNAMAANHQRSKGAIKSKLQKMMKYSLSGLDDI